MVKISINERGYWINNILINSDIFSLELVDYVIEERENLIDNLIDWIGECGRDREHDKDLMKEDLKMLINRKDEFLFSSISTNDYVFRGDEGFDDICKEILEVNGFSFADDKEKMRDFKELSKEDFLKSYSYITKNDYDWTLREVDNEKV